MIVMDTFADVSGGEVIHCTLVYFGSFLCLPKALLSLTVLHHNFSSAPFRTCFSTRLSSFLFKCHCRAYFTAVVVENFHGSAAVGTEASVGII